MTTPQFSRQYRPDLAEKMDARVALDPVTGCWNWTRGVNAEGYGNGINVDRKQTRAHRVAHLVTHGFLPPPDMCIRHLCSNPSCCNPDHLAMGDAWENARDAMEAGRLSHSKKSMRQRKADALVIKLASSGVTHVTLAERLGVSLSTVARTRRRAGVKVAIGRPRKLTEGDVRAIRQSGETNKELAARYDVTAPNIHAIRQRKTWRHVV